MYSPGFEPRMQKIVVVILLLLLVCPALASGQESGSKSHSLSYGFVVDNSGSFRLLMERVIKLVNSVAEKNADDDEAFLLTFVDPQKTRVRQELTSNKAELREATENMYVEGGLSSILDAVRLSIDYLTANVQNRADKKLALVLVSDGDEAASPAKMDTVVTAAKEANIRIIVVGMSDEKVNSKFLDRLAKGTGGVAFYPRTPKETEVVAESVASALRGK